jgi:MurNAc alpha-1-phosphate uridylyltransferase
MVLAAGRGERMRPLTDTCPKPLLPVRGKPLIRYHLEALARAGLDEVVVNTGWLGERLEEDLGPQLDAMGPRGEALRVVFSREPADAGGPFETAGGVARALPLLTDCFWLVGGDVYVPDFGFSLAALDRFASGGMLAHIFLVPNPLHNTKGDFGIDASGLAVSRSPRAFTYSTIGMYRQAFFGGVPRGNPAGLKIPLAPMLREAMERREVSAQLYHGPWTDVGTPQRLAELNDAPR